MARPVSGRWGGIMAVGVLMVEPNPGILIVARNVLTRAGYRVEAVDSAAEGVRLMRDDRFEVVLLDAHQASAENIEIIEAASWPTPMVILTLHRGRVAPQLGFMRARSLARLHKPFAPDRLLALVDTVLTGTVPIPLGPVDDEQTIQPPEEGTRTDLFPFAGLMQQQPENFDGDFDDDTKLNLVATADSAHLAVRFREILLSQGVAINEVDACARELEEVAREELGAALPAAAIQGRLENFSVDQILQIPAHVQAPARLRLEQSGKRIDLYYVGPSLVFARQDNLPPGFMFGRLLEAGGFVTEEQIQDALSHGPPGFLGERLVKGGYVSAEAVLQTLKRQTEELLYEVVRWQHGEFSVYAKDPLPEAAREAGLQVPVQHLLLEGMRRLDEWQRMAHDIGDLHGIVRPLQTGLDDIELSSVDRAVLERVDGRRTVAELMHLVARPSYEVFRSLHGLTGRNLVAVA